MTDKYNPKGFLKRLEAGIEKTVVGLGRLLQGGHVISKTEADECEKFYRDNPPYQEKKL